MDRPEQPEAADPKQSIAPGSPSRQPDPTEASGVVDQGNPPGHDRPDDLLMALGELDIAHERLRAADEELRSQREQIEALLGQHRDELIWREQLSSLLLMAVFVTDLAGVVLEANAAAGLVLQLPLPQLMRQPIASYVAPEGRPSLRRTIERLRDSNEVQRLALLLTPRKGAPVEVAVVGFPGARPSGDRVLRWAMLPSQVTTAARNGAAGAAELDTAAAFAEMCAVPLLTGDRQTLLTRLSEVVARGLSEADGVSITLGSPEEPQWIGGDSKLAQRADGAQMTSGEGPCVEAFRTRAIVVANDTDVDERWPTFARDSQASHVRSVVAVPISAGVDGSGVLNVYATAPNAFGRRSRHVAELFGAAVSSVLEEVASRGSLSQLAAQLEQAMQSRAIIEQAKGIVMAKYGGTPDDAFRRLSTMSQRANTKLRDIARLLVEGAPEAGPAQPSPHEKLHLRGSGRGPDVGT